MIWLRYLLFLVVLGFGAWVLYLVIMAILDWNKSKIRIAKAKIDRKQRLDEEEAKIIENAQEEKTLQDRYKDKLPLDEDLKDEVMK